MRCPHRTVNILHVWTDAEIRSYSSSYSTDGYMILVWYDFIIHSFVNLHKKIDRKFISYKILQKNKKKSLILP